MPPKHDLSPGSKTDKDRWFNRKPGDDSSMLALLNQLDSKMDKLDSKLDTMSTDLKKLQEDVKGVQELASTTAGKLKIIEQQQGVQRSQLEVLQREVLRIQLGDLVRRTSRFSPDYAARQMRQVVFLEGLEKAADPSEALALMYGKLESAGIKLSDGSLMVNRVMPATAAREGQQPRVPVVVTLSNRSVLDALYAKGARDKLKTAGMTYSVDMTQQERADRRAVARHPNFVRARKDLPEGFRPIWRLDACSLEHNDRGCYWPEGRPELLWTMSSVAHAEVDPMVIE